MAKFSDIQGLIISQSDTFSKGLEKTGTFAFRLAKRRITSDMDVNFPTSSDKPHLIRSPKNEALAGDISNNLLNAMFTGTFESRLSKFASVPLDINDRTLDISQTVLQLMRRLPIWKLESVTVSIII